MYDKGNVLKQNVTMIISAFSKHIRSYQADIPPVIILIRWIKDILSKEPENNIEKVIHEEIAIKQNESGLYMLLGKSKSGANLIESLYKFALSYEQQNFVRWIHSVKASDFTKQKD